MTYDRVVVCFLFPFENLVSTSLRTFLLSLRLLVCLCYLYHFPPQLSGSACQLLHITVTPQPLLSVLVLLLSYLSGLYWEDNTSWCFPYSLLSQFTSVCHTKHWNWQDQCKVAEIAKKKKMSLKSLSRFGSDAVCVLSSELCGVSSRNPLVLNPEKVFNFGKSFKMQNFPEHSEKKWLYSFQAL